MEDRDGFWEGAAQVATDADHSDDVTEKSSESGGAIKTNGGSHMREKGSTDIQKINTNTDTEMSPEEREAGRNAERQSESRISTTELF